MTKRSLKGTEITTLAGFTRDAKASIYLENTTPDSLKDNPLALTLVQDLIAKGVTQGVLDGLLELSDTTNDAIALDTSGAISDVGSTFTVLRVFYLVCSGNIFKVNTGSDIETNTMRLQVSSTEDGMYQTADIVNGVSITSFEGNNVGDGIVNVADILWLGSSFSIDIQNDEVNIGSDIVPILDNNVDLGSVTKEFKDLYIDGTAYLDTISGGDATFSGDVLLENTSNNELDIYSNTNNGQATLKLRSKSTSGAQAVTKIVANGIGSGEDAQLTFFVDDNTALTEIMQLDWVNGLEVTPDATFSGDIIASSGDIYLGASSPALTLSGGIDASSGGQIQLNGEGASAADDIIFLASGTEVGRWDQSATQWKFLNNLTVGGNIGVNGAGTTFPLNILSTTQQVAVDIDGQNTTATILNIDNDNANAQSFIRFQNQGSSSTSIGFNDNLNVVGISHTANLDSPSFYIDTNEDATFTGDVKLESNGTAGDGNEGTNEIVFTEIAGAVTDTRGARIVQYQNGSDNNNIGLRFKTATNSTSAPLVTSLDLNSTIATFSGDVTANTLAITDGVTAPSATSGEAKIYVDSSDGDLKVVFGDGTVKTIVLDT